MNSNRNRRAGIGTWACGRRVTYLETPGGQAGDVGGQQEVDYQP